MKLLEITDEPLVWVLLKKVMAAGRVVTLNMMEHRSDFSRWHHGKIVDVFQMPETDKNFKPSTTKFLYHVHYVRNAETGTKDVVALFSDRFNRLHLYKDPRNQENFVLSDRKPQADDDF